MSQAGSLLQAMDITADAAAIDAKTPAASPVGNMRNVSQHAAEKQRAGILPPSFIVSSNKLFPERRVDASEIVGYLKCTEKRLTASNKVNYKKLNESLLEKIVELSQMIKSLNRRISLLEEQYESIKNQQTNSKNFVPVDRPLPVFQPTSSTPEPPMRILPAIPRNGPVNPQTTRVHLAPAKVQNMVDQRHTKVHLINSKNVQHGPPYRPLEKLSWEINPCRMLRLPRGIIILLYPKEGKPQCKTNPISRKNSFRPSIQRGRERWSSTLTRTLDPYRPISRLGML
jgi:hypothetical protein